MSNSAGQEIDTLPQTTRPPAHVGASIVLPTNGKGKTDTRFGYKPVHDSGRVGRRLLAVADTLDVDVGSIEFCSDLAVDIDAASRTVCHHGFVNAVTEAFANEFPLSLSPDHIHTLIVQACSEHVNANSEDLRDVLVAFDGKTNITVNADYLVRKGRGENPNNSDWPRVFPDFEEALTASIKQPQLTALITLPYSTTTLTERTVFSVSLMSTLKKYFSYTVRTRCGIPRVDLLGCRADWVNLISRTVAICKLLKMDAWLDDLLPVLERFVQLFDLTDGGNPPPDVVAHWDSMFYYGRAQRSGESPHCTGWINVFFPYRNGAYTHQADTYANTRYSFGTFPSGANTAPFVWDYFGEELSMNFAAGFTTRIGRCAHTDGAPRHDVVPVLFCAVVHRHSDDSEEESECSCEDLGASSACSASTCDVKPTFKTDAERIYSAARNMKLF